MIVVWVLQASLIVSIYFLSGSFTAHSYQLGALFFGVKYSVAFCREQAQKLDVSLTSADI